MPKEANDQSLIEFKIENCRKKSKKRFTIEAGEDEKSETIDADKQFIIS